MPITAFWEVVTVTPNLSWSLWYIFVGLQKNIDIKNTRVSCIKLMVSDLETYQNRVV